MPNPTTAVASQYPIPVERLEYVPAYVEWLEALPKTASTSYYYMDGSGWRKYSGNWTSTRNRLFIESLKLGKRAETLKASYLNGDSTSTIGFEYVTPPPKINRVIKNDLKKRGLSESDVQKAAKKLAPAIVQVYAPKWSGSGTIVEMKDVLPGYKPTSESKYMYGIITNNHVAPPEVKDLIIKFGNGELKKASVLKGLRGTNLQDEIVDVSLLVIESDKELPTVKIADIAKMPPEMDETVLAAGYSQGLPNVVITVGHVTQPNQLTGDNVVAIQADAAINPGNSGGGLFRIDEDGEPELLGTNTYTFRDAEDMTFAIPISKQVAVLNAIYNNGEYVRGDFGFDVREIKPFEIDGGTPQGARIAWLDRGSPANTAGLKTGDIITAIKPEDGGKYRPNIVNQYQTTEFIEWMHMRAPGERITVSVARPETVGGKTTHKRFEVELEVAKLTRKTSITDEEWGFTAKRTNKGIILSSVEPGSAADEALTKAKLEPGKLYLIGMESPALPEKDAVEVTTLEELKKMLIYLRRGDVNELTLLARPSGSREIVPVTLRREAPEMESPLEDEAAAFRGYELGSDTYAIQ